ncbi:ephrin-B2-like [Macrobrachium nipponense]|uniref:ephrin-B2-like n=1 Tax=Macrobrachium nipponense TaxID=159736 RepID=UPI0030C7BB4B
MSSGRQRSGWTVSMMVTTATVMMMLTIVICHVKVAEASTMHYVYWNTSSPIFRIDNTDHIIDVNKGNKEFEYDQVNIICPVYNNEDTSEELMEKYIIYNVSKEEYDTCRITNSSPRVIAVCDKPRRVVYFTITFRSFTPQPGGLEFIPGQDYYFISTSSKEDLHRRIGGRCTSHHMKVIFKICCSPEPQSPKEDESPNQDSEPPEESSRAAPSTTASTTLHTTPKSTTVVAVTTGNSSYYEIVIDSDVYSTTRKTDSQPPDPGENEIVQKGELVPGTSSAPAGTSNSLYIAFSCALLSLLIQGFGIEFMPVERVKTLGSQMTRTSTSER